MEKISIVSPFYNDKVMLKRTLESVLRQDYANIEHVVADGGSTDGSVDLLKEYEAKYKSAGKELIWVSEKDNGIADGVNKATAMSSGNVIMFMVDVLASSHIITEIMEYFEKRGIDYLFGGLIYQRNGKIVRQWSGKPGNWRFGFMMATPTLCYRRAVWKKHGPYSEKYVSPTGQDVSDYDFQLKLMRDRSLNFQAIRKPLVIYYAGGSSNNNFRYRLACIAECQKALRANNISFPLFTNLCKTLIALFAYTFAPHKKIILESWME